MFRLAAMQNDSALPATATTYSLDELRAFVTYAADRGVRVCPEFDMPGHCSFGRETQVGVNSIISA